MRMLPHRLWMMSLQGRRTLRGRPLPSREEALSELRRYTSRDFGEDTEQWARGLEDAREAAWEVVRQGINLLGSEPCDLLRDTFGNPFRPGTIEPMWREWKDGTIVMLAQGIYHERIFENLAVLADALEEAGC